MLMVCAQQQHQQQHRQGQRRLLGKPADAPEM
jgi:hypothetical protein